MNAAAATLTAVPAVSDIPTPLPSALSRACRAARVAADNKGQDVLVLDMRPCTPLFDFFAGTENAFRVLAADFVSTEDGTGVVHMAPGFGEDDQLACNAVGIPTICPMDEHGRFTAEVAPWVGTHVFDANPHKQDRYLPGTHIPIHAPERIADFKPDITWYARGVGPVKEKQGKSSQVLLSCSSST